MLLSESGVLKMFSIIAHSREMSTLSSQRKVFQMVFTDSDTEMLRQRDTKSEKKRNTKKKH